MPKPLDERIAALKAKKDELAARLNALETKAKSEDRKRATRRKIVVGGAVIVAMEKDEAFAAKVRALLAQQVGRAIDRESIADLLTLPPATLAEQPAKGFDLYGGQNAEPAPIGTRQF